MPHNYHVGFLLLLLMLFVAGAAAGCPRKGEPVFRNQGGQFSEGRLYLLLSREDRVLRQEECRLENITAVDNLGKTLPYVTAYREGKTGLLLVLEVDALEATAPIAVDATLVCEGTKYRLKAEWKRGYLNWWELKYCALDGRSITPWLEDRVP